jgi:uncharacterized phage protein (TIGR01671 family)
MREILFRAKHTHSNEFVYGYGFYSNRDKCYKIDNGDGILYFCKKETIGEYSGQKDKYGTRIFEGDIVKLYLSVEETCYVEFCDGQFVLQSTDKEMLCGSAFLMRLSESLTSKIEVIGNIYDNRDLLEVDNG